MHFLRVNYSALHIQVDLKRKLRQVRILSSTYAYLQLEAVKESKIKVSSYCCMKATDIKLGETLGLCLIMSSMTVAKNSFIVTNI